MAKITKIKFSNKTPHVDMTPMVDLFSVVLIFLMLTTNFRISEPSPVDTPFSVSEKNIADFDKMTIVIANNGAVFFNMDNGPDTLLKYRPKTLQEMGDRYGIEFTDEELRKFEKYPSSIGVPIEHLKDFFAADDPGDKAVFQTGIPMDSLNNQLGMWILYARQVNPNIKAIIKGGADVPYPRVKEVLDLLQAYNVNQFSLVTALEAAEAVLED
jgi:biopolymer transport protein ExbD